VFLVTVTGGKTGHFLIAKPVVAVTAADDTVAEEKQTASSVASSSSPSSVVSSSSVASSSFSSGSVSSSSVASPLEPEHPTREAEPAELARKKRLLAASGELEVHDMLTHSALDAFISDTGNGNIEVLGQEIRCLTPGCTYSSSVASSSFSSGSVSSSSLASPLDPEHPTREAEPAELARKKRLLTASEELEVHDMITHSAPDAVISGNKKIAVSGQQIKCLTPGIWLNDDVINFYMDMLQARNMLHRANAENPKNLRLYFFNSFFATKMKGAYNYDAVKRWSKRAKIIEMDENGVTRWSKTPGIKIMEMDKVLFPVHVGKNHWCLAVINLLEKRFEYYDSLRGSNPGLMLNMRLYLKDEAKEYSETDLDLSGWIDFVPTTIPQQLNGCDCGVFTCKFADYISAELPLEFSQTDMPYFRRRMALEIEKNTVE
jgi:hypothetical protein